MTRGRVAEGDRPRDLETRNLVGLGIWDWEKEYAC